MSEFLQDDLLGQADLANQPAEGAGRDPDVTVRTLLDRAARTIEGKFRGQPLTEAAIRLTIGKAYRALGRYPEGSGSSSDRWSCTPPSWGRPPRDADQQEQPGVPVWCAGEVRPRRAPVRGGGEGRTARLGADHPDTLTSKNNLAQVYRAQKKYAQAEPLYLEVVRADTATLGADHAETLRARTNLAALYRNQARYDLAEPLYEEVVRARTLKIGADHPDTLVGKNGLAAVYKGKVALRRGRGAVPGGRGGPDGQARPGPSRHADHQEQPGPDLPGSEAVRPCRAALPRGGRGFAAEAQADPPRHTAANPQSRSLPGEAGQRARLRSRARGAGCRRASTPAAVTAVAGRT